MARPKSGTDDAVLAVLNASPVPMTAYQILDQLRPTGVQSPPVVYRALERLQKGGRVHRLEQLNAWFACHGHHHEAGVVFALCRECQRVEEWPATAIDAAIGHEATRAGFALTTRTIEVHGLCAACRGDAVPGSHVHGPGCGHEGH